MMRAADIEAQAADWLARRDGDDWSDAQQRELDAWIDAATAHRIAYLRLDSVWRRSDRLGSLHAPGKNAVPPAFFLPLFGNVRAHGWRIAAGVAVLAGAAWFMASSGIVDRPAGYATALGQSTSLALADGTRVTLNTNTHLRAKLAGARRTVWLDKGEAYFEVAHDASRPFVVEAGARRVTVLGTKFSVRRDEGGQVQVLVADGRVQVSATDGPASAANTTVITRHDSLTAGGASGEVAVRHNTEQQIASRLGWREGRLILDQMTLAQAAQEFNRYNRKQLIVTDPSVAQLRIGGTFNVDNVDGFARLLQQGMGLRVDAAGDNIKIHR
jgi:transmembrane sensor